jgi:hypothetical protein
VKLLSWRFAPHLLAVYALAAVPVLLHTFAQSSRDDCARPSALPRWASREDERGRLLRDYFGAFQWSEGSFEAGQALFSFTYLRSYAAIPLLNRPENVLIKRAPEQRSVEWIDTESGPVPIHRALYDPRPDRATRTLAGYLLLFDGQPLAQPSLAQLASAPRQLVFGRTPMTLLFVHGRVPRDQYPEAEAELRVRLLTALAQYRDACRPPASPPASHAASEAGPE